MSLLAKRVPPPRPREPPKVSATFPAAVAGAEMVIRVEPVTEVTTAPVGIPVPLTG